MSLCTGHPARAYRKKRDRLKLSFAIAQECAGNHPEPIKTTHPSQRAYHSLHNVFHSLFLLFVITSSLFVWFTNLLFLGLLDGKKASTPMQTRVYTYNLGKDLVVT